MATTKGGLAKRQAGVQTKVHSIKDLIRSMEPQIKAALPSILTPERFTRMVLTALSSNPKLQECSPPELPGRHDAGCAAGRRAKHPVGPGLPNPLTATTESWNASSSWGTRGSLIWPTGPVPSVIFPLTWSIVATASSSSTGSNRN